MKLSKIRSKSIDTITKKEIALNLLEDLVRLYIRVRTFSFVKGQIQSHKIKQSKVGIKITANLTKEDGFRKLTNNSNHKNSFFISTNI